MAALVPAVGLRIRLLSPMVNPGSTWMPVEKDMPAGLEGTIVHVNFEGPPEWHQISVRWDNGRSLGVFPYKDRYCLLPAKEELPV
jgi:hypothetical protein